jgi:hypothetical protein
LKITGEQRYSLPGCTKRDLLKRLKFRPGEILDDDEDWKKKNTLFHTNSGMMTDEKKD